MNTLRLALLLTFALARTALGADPLVFIGTYTGADSKGIYVARFHTETGILDAPTLAAENVNPSFVAIRPGGKFLYAANETAEFQGSKTGSVSSFALDPRSGQLTLLNTIASRGAGPCHISVDRSGRFVFVANYDSGSAAAFPIQPDGSLGAPSAFIQNAGSSLNPRRQEGPHAHWIGETPARGLVLLSDLGLDKLLLFRFDSARGLLTPSDPPFLALKPGTGPRHFAFSPNGNFGYGINELASTVNAYAFDRRRRALRLLETVSTLPAGFKGESTTAEIAVHPNGRFVYGSNRGHDSIAVFAADPAKGTLRLVEVVPTHGKEPRSFTLDPSGRWLLAANQKSSTITVFRIGAASGRLEYTGHPVAAGTPVCLLFDAPR